MTQMPPPPGVPYQPGMTQQLNQPAQTNVWSIVSLICGIIGCLQITALVAIITGIVGVVQAKTLKTGRGMAIAGIVLAVLWIVGTVGVFTAVGYGVKHGGAGIVNAIVETGVKQKMTIALDSLADGNTVAAKALMPNVSQSQLDDLVVQLKPLGHVKTIGKSMFTSDFTNGQGNYSYSGTITFDQGTKQFDAAGNSAGGMTIDRIDIK